jgi:hypothetical protein
MAAQTGSPKMICYSTGTATIRVVRAVKVVAVRESVAVIIGSICAVGFTRWHLTYRVRSAVGISAVYKSVAVIVQAFELTGTVNKDVVSVVVGRKNIFANRCIIQR